VFARTSLVVLHLTKRHGTFFVIALGESVVAAVTGVAGPRVQRSLLDGRGHLSRDRAAPVVDLLRPR
jgi:hypothetical protein